MDEKLLTVRELADYLRVKNGTIYAMVARRAIPFIKVSSLVRFRLRDVDGYLSKNTKAPFRTVKSA
jgi:excisionase family DNA binding protein